jgi:AhpD family alkylhydroperoxidase
MSKDLAQIAADVTSGLGLLRQASPEAMKARLARSRWLQLHQKQSIPKTKKLMALAVGIVVHCDRCVAYHTKMAHQHGATGDELVETVAVMGGGPAAVYDADAVRAYDAFSGKS